jgi:hypothetical protein
MPRRVAIVQGLPDPGSNRLCHALADTMQQVLRSPATRSYGSKWRASVCPSCAHKRISSNGQLRETRVEARGAIVAAQHLVIAEPKVYGHPTICAAPTTPKISIRRATWSGKSRSRESSPVSAKMTVAIKPGAISSSQWAYAKMRAVVAIGMTRPSELRQCRVLSCARILNEKLKRSSPVDLAASARGLEMISSSLVEVKECAISNVQHAHPYGGQPALDNRRPALSRPHGPRTRSLSFIT